MGKRTKIGLATFLLLILFIPLKRNVFSFIKEKPLNGNYELVEKPEVGISEWFKGDYQGEFNNYFENNFGFRNFFVRVNNQIKYNLFKTTTAKDVEIGKENYLYEGGYIRDYMGYNFIGKDKIVKKIKEIKKIQDELKKEGINLITAFAPGKASYYPEFFPTRYDTTKKTLSNYLCYTQKAKELGLDYIDFNAMFMTKKMKSGIPLFPKGGIHWGEYAAGIALDSLSKYIEKKRNIKMVDVKLKDIVYYDTLQHSDLDISRLMNLLVEPDFYKMPAPIWKVKKGKNNVKPKLLIIGDSYGYGLIDSPITNELFSKVEYWYYNKIVVEERELKGSEIKNLNVVEEIKKFDVVLLLSSETNLFKFDFGFTESYKNGSNR